MSNPISLIGTIATDPVYTASDSKVPFLTFRLASNERRYDRETGNWVDGETNWYSVRLFRSLAENGKDSFHRGDRVVVMGRLRLREWTDDNDAKKISPDIDVDAIGHDVRWNISSSYKRGRDSAASGASNSEQSGEEVADESPARETEAIAA